MFTSTGSRELCSHRIERHLTSRCYPSTNRTQSGQSPRWPSQYYVRSPIGCPIPPHICFIEWTLERTTRFPVYQPPAPLPGRAEQHRTNRLLEALVRVADCELNTSESTGLQRAEKGGPNAPSSESTTSNPGTSWAPPSAHRHSHRWRPRRPGHHCRSILALQQVASRNTYR